MAILWSVGVEARQPDRPTHNSALAERGTATPASGDPRAAAKTAKGMASATIVNPVTISWNGGEVKIAGASTEAYTRYVSRDGATVVALH